jgi:hypothetical protein
MNSGPTSGVLYLSRTAHEAALSRFSAEELNQLDAEQRRLFPPPNRKATLWRYLETYKFEDLLESETFFLCQVAKLAKDEANEGRMNQLQEQALLKYLSNDQTQLENFRAFHEHVRQCSWVTCFSLGDFDEAHMWKTFCKQPPNEGVAIRTNYERLKSSVTGSAQTPDFAMVRYEESHYMPWKHGYLLFQKVPMFSKEREVRVCVTDLEENHPKEWLRVSVNLTRLIQRIFIHPKASPDYLQKISDLATKHLPKNEKLIRWSCHRENMTGI